MNTPTESTIRVRLGVPENYRLTAAKLYADVFAEKYHAVIGFGAQAYGIIAQCIELDQAYAAFDGDRLVGLAGFFMDSRHFLRLRLHVLLQEFGLLVGLWRFFLYICQRKRAPEDELLMDGIVVHPDYRGRGVGSLLITGLAEHGQNKGLRGLRLSVVDTNPRARLLYERLGFRALCTRNYEHLEGWIPFSALTIMRLPLYPGVRAPRSVPATALRIALRRPSALPRLLRMGWAG